jgi:outer membrane protein OmpA-like peptidoglycan-associated protein
MVKLFNNFLFFLAGLILVVPSMAYADTTVKLEPGVAIPMSKPQTNHYDIGAAMSMKILFNVSPYFGFGPSGSFMALSPEKEVQNQWGTTWGVGGTARVMRPHDDAHNTGTGFSAVSPWVDGDIQYVRTGPLDRAGLSLGVGASVPTSDSRVLWVGPFARYNDVVQERKAGYDSGDAHTMIFGVSFELGMPQKRAEVAGNSAPSDRDHDGVPDSEDRCPDVPGPKDNWGCPYPAPVAVPAPDPVPEVAKEEPKTAIEFNQVIQFEFDSAVLRPETNEVLAEVVKTLLTNKDYNIRVEGHASSEGRKEYNDRLSERRASSVLEFLVANGVDRSRLTSEGFGSSQPVASNDTEEGRVLNRRVGFVIRFVLIGGGK